MRARQPALFDPSLLSILPFRLGLGISVAFAAANAGFLLIFAFALQSERGESPLTTGLLHMPYGLGAMIGIAVLGLGILTMARGVFTDGESRRLLPFAFGSAMATASYTLIDGMGARVSGDAIA